MVLCLAAAQPAEAAWTVSTFERAGAQTTQLWSINDAGQFVGSDSLGGYVVTGGVATSLSGPAGAVRTVPFGISNSGLVAGSWNDADNTERGFLYENGQYTNFDVALPDVVRTEIRHISLDGRWLTGQVSDVNGQSKGFVFDRTTSELQVLSLANGAVLMQGTNSAGLSVGSQSPGGALVFDNTTEDRLFKRPFSFPTAPRTR
jgi:hypothetical protein